MSPAPATVSSIGQIALTVTNLPRAVAFYRDVLGMPKIHETPDSAFFDCGGTRLMLSPSERPESIYSSIVYYWTSDIRAAEKRLRAAGVQFESGPRMIRRMPDHELWMAFFRDTEGNLLALMSEVPPKTAS